MYTIEEAYKVGIDACMEKIGKDLMTKHRSTSTLARGKVDDHRVFCFIGVDTHAEFDSGKMKLGKYPTLELTSTGQFEHKVGCYVNLDTEEIVFQE